MYKLNIQNYNWDFNKDTKRLNELIQKRIDGNISKEDFKELKNLNSNIFSYVDKVKNNLITIFSNPLKDVIWHWQDNVVYDYKKNWVIKIMAKKKYEWYKNLQNYFIYKYKLLKKYIGQFITDTYFLEWETINSEYINYNNVSNYEVKYKTIYTAQRKIKWYTLNELPTDIRKKGRLLWQLKKIHQKYIKLKLYLHYIEYQKYWDIWRLKFKMDIWKISNSLDVSDDILINHKTPNIMYDIEKDRIFLIDFDTGSLNEESKEIFDIIYSKNNKEINKIWNKLFEEIKKEYKKITPKNLESFFKKYTNS